jgi:putative transposase
MLRRSYLTDLSDLEYKKVKPLVCLSYNKGGRPCKYSKRELLDAIFYVLRTGCQWRYLPHDFPLWKTVYSQFLRWRKGGIIRRIHYDLIKTIRTRSGRNKNPTVAIVDSQSVKTTEKGVSKAMMELKR